MKKLFYFILFSVFLILSCTTAEDVANMDIPPVTEPLKVVSFTVDSQDMVTSNPISSTIPTFIIEFNNDIDLDTINYDFDHFTPSQSRKNWIYTFYDNNQKKMRLQGGILEADTTYEIKLDTKLKDVYGGTVQNTKIYKFKTTNTGIHFGKEANGSFNNFVSFTWPNPNYYLYAKGVSNEVYRKTSEYRIYHKITKLIDKQNYGSFLKAAQDIDVFPTENKIGAGARYYINYILFKNIMFNYDLLKYENPTNGQVLVIGDYTYPVPVDERDLSKGFRPFYNGEVFRAWGVKVQTLIFDTFGFEEPYDKTYNYYITLKMISSYDPPSVMYKKNTSLITYQVIEPNMYANPYFYRVYEGGFF